MGAGLGMVRERLHLRAAPCLAELYGSRPPWFACPQPAVTPRSSPISRVSSGTATRARAPPWLPKVVRPPTNSSGRLNRRPNRSASSSTVRAVALRSASAAPTSSASTLTGSSSTSGCSSIAAVAGTRPSCPSFIASPCRESADPASGHLKPTTGTRRWPSPAIAGCSSGQGSAGQDGLATRIPYQAAAPANRWS